MNDRSDWNKTVSRLLNQAKPGSLPPLPTPTMARKKIAPRIPAIKPKVEPVPAATSSTDKKDKPKPVPRPKVPKNHEKHKFILNGVDSVFGSSSFEKKLHHSTGGGARLKLHGSVANPNHKAFIKAEIIDEKDLLKEFMDSEMSVVGDDTHNDLCPHMISGQVYSPPDSMDISATPTPDLDLQRLLTDPQLEGQPILLHMPTCLLTSTEKSLQTARLRIRKSGKVEIQVGPMEGSLDSSCPLTSLHLPAVVHNSSLSLLSPPQSSFQFSPSFHSVLD